MRVNIQYSVEMDRIPDEMQTLVNTTVVESMDVIGNMLQDFFHNDQPEDALSAIDEARQGLFAADERLSDVASILRGYIVQRAALIQAGEEVQSEVVETPRAPPVTTGEPPMMPASEDTMSMVRATLSGHRAETEALRRTMNLGFEGSGGADGD